MALSQDELLQVLRKLTHDLRGPLINVRMALEVIVALDDGQEREALGGEIDQELRRLDQLIQRTAELAQAGHCQPTELPLRSVVAQFMQQLDGAIVPEASLECECRVRVDVDKILQLLSLLYEEAVSQLADREQPKICLSLSREDGCCVIKMEDNSAATGGDRKLDVSEAFFRIVLSEHEAHLERSTSEKLGGRCSALSFPVVTP